ncbi:hypothetical protein CMEL01_04273 [Colletotrichum melonis]|uniref:Uncharacterized protein n=1 Tax=Colletotrichum melonis TaxID=1209925 RepID=A0AAI9XPP1_9PEZI|nr:hypothetical protein CMEL01_04273 [Colletotrichum melonis]
MVSGTRHYGSALAKPAAALCFSQDPSQKVPSRALPSRLVFPPQRHPSCDLSGPSSAAIMGRLPTSRFLGARKHTKRPRLRSPARWWWRVCPLFHSDLCKYGRVAASYQITACC